MGGREIDDGVEKAGMLPLRRVGRVRFGGLIGPWERYGEGDSGEEETEELMDECLW